MQPPLPHLTNLLGDGEGHGADGAADAAVVPPAQALARPPGEQLPRQGQVRGGDPRQRHGHEEDEDAHLVCGEGVEGFVVAPALFRSRIRSEGAMR